MSVGSTVLDRVGGALARPGDTEDELNEKVLAAGVVAAGVFNLVLVGTVLMPMGLPLASRLSYVAAFVFLLADLGYVWRRGSQTVLHAMFGANLLFPFVLQWAMGGIVASGAAMLWGLGVPMGVPLVRARGGAVWFAGFIVLVFAAAVMEASGWLPLVPHSMLRMAVLFAFNVCGVSVLTYLFLGRFIQAFREAKLAVQRERERSDALLLNILPAATADRLKSGETVIADRYDEATVLFADIVGFTPYAARLAPDVVVGMLNDLFSLFDDLAGIHGLEKIKTIGDSYMAVAGTPTPRTDHAGAAVRMARDMLEAVERYRVERDVPLDVRIGLHSGPLLAGVIGKRKFAYDVYGDTVNTASRMESHGVPGAIHVSDATYALVSDSYPFERREPIVVKGKGLMSTYLLGRQPDGVPSGVS